MTRFEAPGLFTIRLDDTHRLRAPGRDAAAKEERLAPLQRKRSHPPSQLHTLSKWSRESIGAEEHGG